MIRDALAPEFGRLIPMRRELEDGKSLFLVSLGDHGDFTPESSAALSALLERAKQAKVPVPGVDVDGDVSQGAWHWQDLQQGVAQSVASCADVAVHRQRLNECVAANNLVVKDVPCDEHSQYSALCDQLVSFCVKISAAELRHQVWRWLDKHRRTKDGNGESVEAKVDILTSQHEGDLDARWTQWLTGVKSGQWGDSVTLLAAAAVLHSRIQLFTSIDSTYHFLSPPAAWMDKPLNDDSSTLLLGHWHKCNYAPLAHHADSAAADPGEAAGSAAASSAGHASAGGAASTPARAEHMCPWGTLLATPDASSHPWSVNSCGSGFHPHV
eukprot:gene57927-biopygen33130